MKSNKKIFKEMLKSFAFWFGLASFLTGIILFGFSKNNIQTISCIGLIVIGIFLIVIDRLPESDKEINKKEKKTENGNTK